MPIDIRMPALSPTMEKGNLARWLKKEGERVKPGDVIAEIETDKATMEYEAVDEGTLAKILVPEGTADVPVNQIIAVLAGEGEDVKAAAAGAGKGAPAPKAQAAAPAPASKPASCRAAPPRAGCSTKWLRQTSGRTACSHRPLARRIAKEAGIDVGRVQGSGPHGRVIARDVEAAQDRRRSARRASGYAEPMTMAAAPSDEKIRALFAPGSYEVVPHDNIRKVIAQRLTLSKQTIPHFYLTVDCDIGRLLAAREEINAAAPKDKDGAPAYKLSVNDFVIKALALALQKVPDANVTWTEGAMLRHKSSDVGVAVAIPGGLITPVVRRAETKSLSAISERNAGFCRAGARAQTQAGRISGRLYRDLESRHVWDQGIRGGDQSAAGDDSGGRNGRGARGRAQGQDRSRDDDDGDTLSRSPRGRWRGRRGTARRVQDADREPGDDGGVSRY